MRFNTSKILTETNNNFGLKWKPYRKESPENNLPGHNRWSIHKKKPCSDFYQAVVVKRCDLILEQNLSISVNPILRYKQKRIKIQRYRKKIP